ncbi:hypothetical protein DFH11DRAFT_43573 [Phellopilus nigrolimitatus]|nr:hypothetical protein DFH11DRAFT_43573 [Phellopilus nigrolimitatus]
MSSESEDSMGSDGQLPDGSQPISSLKRLDGLWFDDGNVIVVAENTAFRVHKGVLSQHSVVFEEMFATDSLQPSGSLSNVSQTHAELHDVPVVALQQDSAFDMSCFLRALYDWSFLYRPYLNKYQFPAISGLLRIATKYMAGNLRKVAIDIIASVHPEESHSWTWGNESPSRQLAPFEDEAFAYFRLALEVDVKCILPGSSYTVCKYSLERIRSELPHVSPSMLWDLIIGREKVHAFEREKFHAYVLESGIADHPNSSFRCSSFLRSALDNRSRSTHHDSDYLNFAVFLRSSKQMCPDCQNACYRIRMNMLDAIIPQLPSIFGLEPYAVLRNLDNASSIQ